MDADDQDFRRTLAFALKHKTRLLAKSKIAGWNDDAAMAAADKIADHLKACGYVVGKKPVARAHSADCGRRNR